MPLQPHVLIVDDDDLARMTTALQVETLGLSATAVGSANEAVAWLADGNTAIVLIIDVNLRRGVDGNSLAAQLALEQPQQPVVLVSGMAPVGSHSTAALAGIPVLAKPFAIADLRRAIALAIRDRGSTSPWPDA